MIEIIVWLGAIAIVVSYIWTMHKVALKAEALADREALAKDWWKDTHA